MYTGHSRGTYAIWHSICERIRCLATQTTAIGFHLMNRRPERAFRSIFAAWARLKLDPTPAPATLVLHSLPATYRLDDSPQCRPTELCTDTHTRSSERDIVFRFEQTASFLHPAFSFSRVPPLTHLNSSKLSRPRLGRRRGKEAIDDGKNRSLKISRLRREGEGQSS